MNKLIKPFVCIMALTIPTLASADVESNQVNENEVVVTYNAAEATTESVSIELERQVRRAAKKVCGPQNLSRAGDIRRLLQNRDCYKNSVADALYSIKINSNRAS